MSTPNRPARPPIELWSNSTAESLRGMDAVGMIQDLCAHSLALEELVQSLVNATTPMVHILPAIAAQPEFDQSETKQRINEIVICGDVALAQAAELGFTPTKEPRK